ncbi:inner-membrane translocator [Rubrobacter xylanophilus DSM 9941]|uniref:Inner-membrane translocator n=1 Tax=Rubrobacter xylanophilus (strain DSM 9941 / JCM 11954 / NBRC 16129 / PRD-1) TaxID=266117 RepID=Q1AXG4_RUBXD|nr:ABC transporter permease [Rubrobacter xylanophilus]ABG03914.1 inner-membrane translocator [Rubrobacter xylanophilus DSM 9941]
MASLARRVRPRELLSRGGPLGGLVLLCAVMAVLSPSFLTVTNFFNVGTQIAVILILALGQTFVIVSGGIDLSVGSVLALAGVVFGWATAVAGLPLAPALLLGLGAGAAAGLVNGLLITLGNLPPFIATLAMLSAARGLALVISGGVPLSPIPEPVRHLGSGDLFGAVPLPVVLMIAMWLLTAAILRYTYPGRCMYAIGGNEEAARLSGIGVGRQKLLIYTLSGLFAGVAGILQTARLASAQPQAGFTFELDAIAAVVIGGASLTGGVGTASGTLIGALILGVLRNGLNLLNVSAFWQQVVIGAVIALAVMTDTLRRRRK